MHIRTLYWQLLHRGRGPRKQKRALLFIRAFVSLGKANKNPHAIPARYLSGPVLRGWGGYPKKNPAQKLSGHLLRRAMNTGNCISKRINIDRRMEMIIDMHIRMSTSTNTHMNNDGVLPRHTEHSATGTRTRVARVRAEYPNQLDYSGAGLRSNNMLAICANTLETQSRDTFENKQSSLCVYVCVCVVCVWVFVCATVSVLVPPTLVCQHHSIYPYTPTGCLV